MSRLNKKPVHILPNVSVSQDGNMINVKGPLGTKVLPCLPFVDIVVADSTVRVTSGHAHRQARMNQGTMWSLLKNAIHGVANGFMKTLEISGVGYRALLEGKVLVLSLGYVNPIRFEPPSGISIVVEKNSIKISGIDKEIVGLVAAKIRSFRKPEPYKGKGIRYEGEVIRRKTGKKAAAAGASG